MVKHYYKTQEIIAKIYHTTTENMEEVKLKSPKVMTDKTRGVNKRIVALLISDGYTDAKLLSVKFGAVERVCYAMTDEDFLAAAKPYEASGAIEGVKPLSDVKQAAKATKKK